MPVLKNKTQGNYVNVYSGIVRDKALCLKDSGMLLTLLSLPDNWSLSIRGLEKILPDGKTSINASLNNLQKSGYLTKVQTRESDGAFGENIIEVHETPICLPCAEKRDTANSAAENRQPEKQPQLSKKHDINFEKKKQEMNYLSIYPADAIETVDAYTVLVKENIEYDILCRDYSQQKDIIDEVTALVIEMVSIAHSQIKIGGDYYPYQVVKARFLSLDFNHIQYVMECMNRNTTKIRNIKNYLLTALFNAPATIGNYYKAEVNYDIYGGGEDVGK